LDLPNEQTTLNNVMIEFVPARDSRQLGAGELRQRMEIEAIKDTIQEIPGI
jgi:hypothetical protein